MADLFTDLIDNNLTLLNYHIATNFDDTLKLEDCDSTIYEQPYQFHVGKPSLFENQLGFMIKTMNSEQFSIAQSARWVVIIEPYNKENLINEILKTSSRELVDGDANGWKFNRSTVEILLGESAQSTIGCIFALNVNQSSESLSTNHVGGTGGSMQGFVKTPISTGRADMADLTMVFKETNSSYTDFVLRPWLTLTAHKGLFARKPEDDIKSKITVINMVPSRTGRVAIRKIFTYHNCAPISIGAEDLTYDAPIMIQRQVSFTYSHYTVSDK